MTVSHFWWARNSKESSLCCGLSALLVLVPDGTQRVDVNANEKKEPMFMFGYLFLCEQKSMELELNVWLWALSYVEESGLVWEVTKQ